MTFYLGTHVPRWLWNPMFRGVPLFVSAGTLRTVKRPKLAVTRWALDSRGFTELTMYGRWTVSPEQYAGEVRAWSLVPGDLDWAAPQDWMCEEFVCAATLLAEGLIATHKTGPFADRVASCLPLPPGVWAARVAEHQKRTVANFLKLRSIAPDLPFIPVLQGWSLGDYLSHVEQYRAAGVDLRDFGTVGVGSVCRRQAMGEAAEIMRELSARGLRVHGFGFKLQGIKAAGRHMTSADSLAWSYSARKRGPQPGCSHGKRGDGRCNNCPRFALEWRRGVPDTDAVPDSIRDAFGL